ncbi:hypothetical protein GEMRC1_005668 [Eukaryota sp. GEM-RC1]
MSARLASLKNQPINLVAIRDKVKSDLLDQLRSVQGAKALVIDPELIGPIKLIVLQEELRSAGITAFYSLSSNLPPTAPAGIFFIARATPQNVYKICDSKQVCGDVVQGSTTRRSYKVLFVPHVTQVVTRLLEQRNILSSLKLAALPLNLIPLDDDILSLEHPLSFRQVFIDGDTSAVYQVAHSILDIERRHGVIVKIVALGKHSISCAQALQRLKKSSEVTIAPQSPEIERLILMDRTFDPISPMCTQLTYEGLIDEVIGINSGVVQLPASIHGKEVPKALNSNDSCFPEFRNLNFAALLPILHKKASSITATVEELERLKNTRDARIEDVQELWNNVPAYLEEKKYLPEHLNLAEYLLNATSSTIDGRLFHRKIEHEQLVMSGGDPDYIGFIEELIGRGSSFESVIRLMCLYSQMTGGFKKSVYEHLKKDVLLEYGFHHVFTFIHLETLGLLKFGGSKSFWTGMRQKLKLVNENPDESDPNDMDFVYSGYTPLSCRLIQRIISNLSLHKPTFESLDEHLAKLGPVEEFSQEIPPGTVVKEDQGPQLNFCFFIGGLTFAEASALRWMSSKGLPQRNGLLLGTTNLCNGSTMVKSLVEGVPGL